MECPARQICKISTDGAHRSIKLIRDGFGSHRSTRATQHLNYDRLVSFYEAIRGVTAALYTPDFAELVTPRGTLALGSTRTLKL